MGDDGKKLSTGRFARLAKLASLSARVSTEVVTKGFARLASGGDVSGLLGQGAAEKLVATLGDLKGLAMKIGQQVSMDPDLLTPEVRAVVARLQNQASPMAFETVRQVIVQQLGRDVNEAFAQFEPTPMAAASLGQVHRAKTHDGHDVAVKVQYPDIAKALESDLDNLGAMVTVVTSATRLTHGRAYYAELRDALLDELDYRREGERLRVFAQAARAFPDLVVPQVYDGLTAEKVLTLELLPGRPVKDALQRLDDESPAARFSTSRSLVRVIWGPFFGSGVVHADPHPGNFLLLDDGRLGVLDYGAIKQMSPVWVDVNRRMFRDLCAGRRVDVVALSRESGFQFDDVDAARPIIETVVDIATRPLRGGADFDFATAGISRDMRNHFIRNAPKMPGLRPPREAVQFFRAVGGLSQNLENLKARGDFRRVWEELLDPP